MGVQRIIRHAPSAVVDWAAIRDRLAADGETAVIRMIDGLPAFPDEVPGSEWRELRVMLAGGMVTLKRQAGAIMCMVWGNADPTLLAARDRLCEVCAAATGGVILGEDESANLA